MRKFSFYLFLVMMFFLPQIKPVSACDSCGVTLARVSSKGKLEAPEKPVFFDFNVEQIVWHKRDVKLAHELHEEGHDAHNKTTEEFYHFALGANLGKWFTVLAELPYIVRHALNIEGEEIEHEEEEEEDEDGAHGLPPHVGDRQTSHGFGDLKLTGIFKALQKDGNFIGPLAGIKLPTSKTTNEDAQGHKYEPEMQPGSGSFDTLLGGAFQYQWHRFSVHGNVIYTLRTKGAQEFRFGNLFSTYLFLDYLLNSKSKYFQSKIGVDSSLQHEGHQRDHGEKISDSGGTTWLLGPKFSVQGNDHISVFSNILFPIYQNPGGVHQEVRFVWNAGVKISI